MENPLFADLPVLKGTAEVEFLINGSSIVIEVYGNDAPITAGNFVDLVERGVYDNVPFHRVITEPNPFVAQGGDPQGSDPNFPLSNLGTGSYIDPETGEERLIPLEIKLEGDSEPTYGTPLGQSAGNPPPDVVLENELGSIAMARTIEPDSASSQFYFALDELEFLDGDYAVFGKVTEGLDVLTAIEEGDRIEDAEVVSGLDRLAINEDEPDTTDIPDTSDTPDTTNTPDTSDEIDPLLIGGTFGTAENDTLEAGINIPVKDRVVFAGEGDDLYDLTASEGNNRLFGGAGEDTFVMGAKDTAYGGEDSDRFFFTAGGDNVAIGGAGADQFWIASAEIPESINVVSDYEVDVDVIGVAGLNIGFDDLQLKQVNDNTVIAVDGSDLAILLKVDANELSADNFVIQ